MMGSLIEAVDQVSWCMYKGILVDEVDYTCVLLGMALVTICYYLVC